MFKVMGWGQVFVVFMPRAFFAGLVSCWNLPETQVSIAGMTDETLLIDASSSFDVFSRRNEIFSPLAELTSHSTQGRQVWIDAAFITPVALSGCS